jgi:hypothetical protein
MSELMRIGGEHTCPGSIVWLVGRKRGFQSSRPRDHKQDWSLHLHQASADETYEWTEEGHGCKKRARSVNGFLGRVMHYIKVYPEPSAFHQR